MKFATQYTKKYNHIQPHSDVVHTVPNDSYTIQQLYQRLANGIQSGSTLGEPQYFEDLEIPKIEDLTDIQHLRDLLQRRENELRMKIKDEKESLQKKAAAPPEPEPKPEP